MAPIQRGRFPPPWDIEEHNRSCFIVRDNNGQALAYVYFESEPGTRSAAGLLTRDEARRIAAEYRQTAGAVEGRAMLSSKRSRQSQGWALETSRDTLRRS